MPPNIPRIAVQVIKNTFEPLKVLVHCTIETDSVYWSQHEPTKWAEKLKDYHYFRSCALEAQWRLRSGQAVENAVPQRQEFPILDVGPVISSQDSRVARERCTMIQESAIGHGSGENIFAGRTLLGLPSSMKSFRHALLDSRSSHLGLNAKWAMMVFRDQVYPKGRVYILCL